jgi:uncharacterized protein YkwD
MRRAGWLAALWLSAAFAGATAHAQQDCAADPQLTEAAAELLLARIARPDPQSLGAAVRAAGSDAVGLHALFVPAGSPPDTEQKWLASLRARVDGELVCGRADNEAGRLVIGLGRGADLEPLDPGTRVVRGKLRAGFRDAELVIAAADAQLLRVGVNAESLREGVELSPELAPLKVQLVARGPAGPRPVAERELAAPPGAAAAPAVREAVGGAAQRTAAARPANETRELATRVLRLRASRGRTGLRPNRLLDEAAARHAQDVCAQGRVAHEVEAGVGPDARLAQTGLDARLLGEAIARADSSDSALAALENSPSHLFTLLDPRFTDFGIGVAQDSAHKHCYVVLLCAWPRYIGPRGR